MSKALSTAVKIVEKLTSHGYIAYFAGGWVRDFLLNHPSDDIDIATNATPEEIQALFSRTIPIGIAFGIVLVIENNHSFEIATFRKEADYKDARRPTKISFTTAIEDAKRRDFTINGMFYDPLKKEVLDYVEGKKDLEQKLIRAIGNPQERIKEDRLRMIRAVRFSCRLSFSIEEETKKAIVAHSKELFPYVAIERVWQELDKMAKFAHFDKALCLLAEFSLLEEIFPALKNKSDKNLQKKLLPLLDFPSSCPTIAKILLLFEHDSLEEKLALCRYFKLSNEDRDFVSFYHESEKKFQQKQWDDFDWAQFLAHKWSETVLGILLAKKQNVLEREVFNKKQKEKKELLQKEILRIQEKKPLVKSLDLKRHKIQDGPSMGKLLALAQKIAINEKITDPEKVIEILKQSTLWPKEDEAQPK